MVVFSNCKINLGLHITGKRPDGYHDLETVFFPISFYDVVEAVQSASFSFSTGGLSIPGNAADNLCVKAYHLLKTEAPALPPVQLHLHKNIPMGAGLGGGSANAAFTLWLLNEKFNLNIAHERLLQLALQLGSDCPFFLENKPCLGMGRGEQLTPVEVNLKNYRLLLVLPGLHVGTREAFAGIAPAPPPLPLTQVMQAPVSAWKEILKNDFEKTVFTAHPVLEEVKKSLYSMGATYAAMSGSGSTLFALFEKNAAFNADAFPFRTEVMDL